MMHRQAQRPVDSAPPHRRCQGSARARCAPRTRARQRSRSGRRHRPAGRSPAAVTASICTASGTQPWHVEDPRAGAAPRRAAGPRSRRRSPGRGQQRQRWHGPPHHGAPGRDCAGFVRSCAVSGAQRSGAGGKCPCAAPGRLWARSGAPAGRTGQAARGWAVMVAASARGAGWAQTGRAPRRVSLRTPTTIRTTARAISQAATISTSGKSATLGGLGRLRGGAWPLVRRQFAAQARKRSLHAVLDSVAGDHAGGAVVALRRGSCSAVGSGVRLSGMV